MNFKRRVNLPSSPKAETSWALESGDPKWCEWRFRLVVVCSKRTVWPHSIGFPREHCFFGLGPGEEKIQAFKKNYTFFTELAFLSASTRKEVRNFIHSNFGFYYRAVGRSENSGVPVLFGGHNLPLPPPSAIPLSTWKPKWLENSAQVIKWYQSYSLNWQDYAWVPCVLLSMYH